MTAEASAAENVSATPEPARVTMLPNVGTPMKRVAVRRPADARASDAAVVDGAIVLDFEGSEETVESVGFSGVHCPRCDDPRGADLGVVLQVQGRQFPSGLVDRWVCVMPTTSDDVDIADFNDLISLDEARLGADGARRLGQALIDTANLLDGLSECRKRKPPKVSQQSLNNHPRKVKDD